MSEEKVKIIDAEYDNDKSLTKIKVLKIDSGKEVTWALTGDDFDSLMSQITGKSLKYCASQREILCKHIINMECTNKVQIDIDNPDLDEAKDKNISELQHHHDTIDMYPFYEVQQEAIEESMKQSEEQ
jgi:hypothetical protein